MQNFVDIDTFPQIVQEMSGLNDVPVAANFNTAAEGALNRTRYLYNFLSSFAVRNTGAFGGADAPGAYRFSEVPLGGSFPGYGEPLSNLTTHSAGDYHMIAGFGLFRYYPTLISDARSYQNSLFSDVPYLHTGQSGTWVVHDYYRVKRYASSMFQLFDPVSGDYIFQQGTALDSIAITNLQAGNIQATSYQNINATGTLSVAGLSTFTEADAQLVSTSRVNFSNQGPNPATGIEYRAALSNALLPNQNIDVSVDWWQFTSGPGANSIVTVQHSGASGSRIPRSGNRVRVTTFYVPNNPYSIVFQREDGTVLATIPTNSPNQWVEFQFYNVLGITRWVAIGWSSGVQVSQTAA